MSFFNKKEEVLEFQLTEYGKRKLQLGRLNPTYYAFFDDDVLYDTAAAGFTEGQNSADRRIRFETPSLKPQKSTTGAETRVNQFQGKSLYELQEKNTAGAYLISENSVEFTNVLQDTPHYAQKFFLGSDPLGTSDLKTEYAPGWHINLLENEISASQYYQAVNLTGTVDTQDGVIRNIPQIDITIDYKTFYSRDEQIDMFTEVEAAKILQLSDKNDSGVALFMQENCLVLDIQERNTDFLKENFEIEVFRNNPDGTSTKLMFLDDAQGIDAPLDPEDTVEYYMNIDVDASIPLNVLRRNNIDLRTVKGHVARTNLTRDLYTSDNEEPC
jgi:hypothetical protein